MLNIFSCAYCPSICLLWNTVYLGLLPSFCLGFLLLSCCITKFFKTHFTVGFVFLLFNCKNYDLGTICWKTILFFTEWSWYPFLNQLIIDVWVYFWIFNSIWLIYMSVFMQALQSLNYCGFKIHLKLGSINFPA